MPTRLCVLITGGAGFLGAHLTRRLLTEGCTVAVLDNFHPQIHESSAQHLPADLKDYVELHRGDIRNRDLVCRALANKDVVVHLAAETGTGQSMYEISRYAGVNIGGTAILLDRLANSRNRVNRIVLASSRAVYGEGRYQCSQHDVVYPVGRKRSDLQAGRYEPLCPVCGNECAPLATAEDSIAHPVSFYGLTKKTQEEMLLMFAATRGLSAYAMRYQNVFGPGQSLRNAYTGILSIFSNLARSNSPIEIFEDGEESRDFVFVDDAVDATWRCIAEDSTKIDVLNVGSGQRTSVLDAANEIGRFFGSKSDVKITGAFRHGDIRHNFADLTRIHQTTGFVPRFTFREGLQKTLAWIDAQDQVPIGFESSLREMAERGLFQRRLVQ